MRTGFEGYFRPSEDEFAELWEHGLIVLDTNVLLDLYRLPTTASSNILSILEKNAERIWLPHQVAAEFHRRRITVIATQRKTFRDLREALEGIKETMKQLTRQQHDIHDKEAS